MNAGAQMNIKPVASGPDRLPATRLPELLAPAGDWECARAAVENGADGIYFGLERFNARMRAHNFTVADLPQLIAFLHRRGVKGYVTFNTLVFAEELAEAEKFLRAIICAGVDAAIVQDVGMARLIRALSPNFPMHASTQMTVTSAAGVEFAGALGCDRVILARECPLSEIGKIREELAAPGRADRPAASPQPELEVFVHGALCVAYSGQCLTSEALGGRSANRGECAQACRMPFELICDGQVVPLGDRRYLLSPQDLAALELLPEIVRLGVASIKIEGRLKSPEYVANITRVYRQALDRLGAAARPAGLAQPGDVYDMEMAFSRGLYTGWFRGINNQALVHARFGKKRGVYLGQVSRVQGDAVILRLESAVKPGDGVVFDAGRPDQEEEGGRVYGVRAGKGGTAGRGPGKALTDEAALTFGRGDVDFARIHPGDRVWKTSDPELERRIRRTFEGDQPRFVRPVHMEVHGSAGQPMTLIAQDESGHVVKLESTMPLAPAQKQPLTAERLREQLGRLGGTPLTLGELKFFLEGSVILPISELNRLRREAAAGLEVLRAQPGRWSLNSAQPLAAGARLESPVVQSDLPSSHEAVRVPRLRGQGGVSDLSFASPRPAEAGTPTQSLLEGEQVDSGHTFREEASALVPELVVLVRSLGQMDAALRCGVSTLYCELEDPKRYGEAVARFREGQAHATIRGRPPAIFLAPPRITKMGEDWILRQVRAGEADGYLVRNYDHLKYFAGSRCLGDFSLNVANPLAAEHFIRRCGLERVTASYDLNADQLTGLLQAAPPEWFEITIHQHMPLFHMEHCIFCAFLSKGTDYTNCGRPCDKHEVELRDRVGARHPVKADAGCRNTVYNALAQTGAGSVARFLDLGARRFRIEFLAESPDRVEQTIRMYRGLLQGEVTASQLWRELKLINRLGVTRGQMEKEEPHVPKWGEIEW
jgi:U32 family peptidase